MFIAEGMQDYAVLDVGEGMKLENWAGYLLARPDPQAIWRKQMPEYWAKADALYHRSKSGGGSWEFRRTLPQRWQVGFGPLRFYVHPTGFKHTGLFPEQSFNWRFIMDTIRPGEEMLNLFAYTGGATLAAAAAGASVTHVDAARSMVSWAKENAGLSGLGDRPIRYIVDDCLKFVRREERRGRRYAGVIMDPPSYGRGSGGEVWRMEDTLDELVAACAKILCEKPRFFIINSYTTGFSAVVTANLLHIYIKSRFGGSVEADTLVLPIRNSALYLPCGTTARWKA